MLRRFTSLEYIGQSSGPKLREIACYVVVVCIWVLPSFEDLTSKYTGPKRSQYKPGYQR
jgi:hypothetical protein